MSESKHIFYPKQRSVCFNKDNEQYLKFLFGTEHNSLDNRINYNGDILKFHFESATMATFIFEEQRYVPAE